MERLGRLRSGHEYNADTRSATGGASGCLTLFLFIWVLLAGSSLVVLFRREAWLVILLNLGLLGLVTLVIAFLWKPSNFIRTDKKHKIEIYDNGFIKQVANKKDISLWENIDRSTTRVWPSGILEIHTLSGEKIDVLPQYECTEEIVELLTSTDGQRRT